MEGMLVRFMVYLKDILESEMIDILSLSHFFALCLGHLL